MHDCIIRRLCRRTFVRSCASPRGSARASGSRLPAGGELLAHLSCLIFPVLQDSSAPRPLCLHLSQCTGSSTARCPSYNSAAPGRDVRVGRPPGTGDPGTACVQGRKLEAESCWLTRRSPAAGRGGRDVLPGGLGRPLCQWIRGCTSRSQNSRRVSQRCLGSQTLGKPSQASSSVSAQTTHQHTLWSLAWGARDPFPRDGASVSAETAEWRRGQRRERRRRAEGHLFSWGADEKLRAGDPSPRESLNCRRAPNCREVSLGPYLRRASHSPAAPALDSVCIPDACASR